MAPWSQEGVLEGECAKYDVFYCDFARDRAFRVGETSGGVTVYRFLQQISAGDQSPRPRGTSMDILLSRQNPYS